MSQKHRKHHSHQRLKASWLIAATIVIAGTGGAAYWLTQKSPEEMVLEAKTHLQTPDYKSATIELRSALQKQPNNAEARTLLGLALYQMGNYLAAEKELTRARQLGAQDDVVLPLLAKVWLKTGHPRQVIDTTIPKTGVSAESVAALHAAQAEANFMLGKRNEALRSITAGEQAAPLQIDLLLVKAKYATANRQEAQAMALVEQAIKSDKRPIEALYMKAMLLERHNQTDEAAKVYHSIVLLDSRQYDAYLALARLDLQAKRVKESEKNLQAAEKIAPNVPLVKYSRGIFELSRGRYKEASDALLQVLRVLPNHLPTVYAQAMASYGMGNYEETLQRAQRVLAQTPGNLQATRLLAAAQLKTGDAKAALNTLLPLIKAHDEDPRLLAMAGEAYAQTGDNANAMALFNRAIALDPKNPDILSRKAASHIALGETDLALADLERATSASKAPGRADFALVTLHLQRREFDAALQALTVLEKKQPPTPVSATLRASALLGKKDLSGARNALEQALSLQADFYPAIATLANIDIQEHKHDAARKRFEDLLTKSPNHLDAMVALATLAAKNRQEKEYLNWLEKAAKTHPDAIPPRAELVRYYLARNNVAKALSIAREAANANPDHPDALNLLGATQLSTGDATSAIATFTRLTEIRKQSPDAFTRLALAQIGGNKLQEARSTLSKALQLGQDHLQSLDLLLGLELKENKPAAALALAQTIQRYHSKAAIGYDREGDIRLMQKQPDLAVKAYQNAIAKGASARTVIKLHRLQEQIAGTKAAERPLTAWLAQHPGDNVVRAYVADYYMRQGRTSEAITEYQRLLKRSPNDVVILNNLANLYQQVKDTRALGTAEQALKIAPDNAAVLDTLGWILVDQPGQAQRGLDLLRKAVTLAPKNPTIRYHFAVALARNGRAGQARKELEPLVNGPANFPEKAAATLLMKSL